MKGVFTNIFSIISIFFGGFNTYCENPNIVLILADDVGSDMFSCYGQKGTAQTPNIDRIAKEGVQFKTCFAPAICAPSRALFMTGVYANRTGVFRNDMWAFDSRGKLFTDRPSWSKLLQEAGYVTAIAGKWHCGNREPWDENVGFDEYCLWEEPKKIESYFGINPISSGVRKNLNLSDTRYWYPSTVENGKYLEVTEKDFGPDQRCDFLLDFMVRMTEEEKPFVAYWPTVIPHGPYSTTPDQGKPLDLELDKPDLKSLNKDEKANTMAKYEKIRTQRFVRLIEYMDKLIGKLIKKAKDLGIYENTYFIFCSDNGTAVTAKDRGVERGVHVPYVVKGPGIKPLGITNELTDFSDVSPTLLEMADISKPDSLYFDGKSQLPFLTGKSNSHREWIYAYTGSVQVLRTKKYLLEARSHLFGKPEGRFYFTGDNRFGRGYERAEGLPEHAPALSLFKRVLDNMPSHLQKDHPFWGSEYGNRWMQNNPKLQELSRKQLYNHPDYSRYDESD